MMDSAAEDILLQKVEELVLDEDQIVTNSVLCVKLNICLTDAKLLSEKYVSDMLSSGKISVTYLICGKLKTGDYGIQIIEATLLKEKRKIFSNITNETVFSIQKSNNIDLNLIAAVENAGNESSNSTALRGSIVSEKCTECILKMKVLPPLPPQKNFEKRKPASFFKPVTKPQLSGEVEETKSDQTSVKNNTKNQKKVGSLASFFSQSSQNKVENKHSEEYDKKLKAPKTAIVEAKTLSNNKVEEVDQVINDNSDEEGSLNSNENGDTNQQIKRDTKSQKDIDTNPRKNGDTNSQKRKVPKKQKKEDGRKRKRIIMDSDSDDDLFGNNEDERMVLEESDEEQVAVAKVLIAPVPRNKKRKAVEKTYEDEEGYIVTRTEFVLVSASEDEEEKSETKKKPEISKIIKTELKEEIKTELREEKKLSSVGKSASKKKGKAVAANQSSIMNFFKKK